MSWVAHCQKPCWVPRYHPPMKQLTDLAGYQIDAAAKRRLLELGKIRLPPHNDTQVELPTQAADNGGRPDLAWITRVGELGRSDARVHGCALRAPEKLAERPR